jgi:L-alanine-DL-glutamate epimerase-like enolase superfamily enzyme
MAPPTLLAGLDLVDLVPPLPGHRLLRATLADGTTGLGELLPGHDPASLDRVRGLLLGHDVRSWRRLAALLWRDLRREPAGRYAAETAILDALCRHAGLPLAALLGGSTHRLRVAAPLPEATSPLAWPAARAAREAGFLVLRTSLLPAPLPAITEALAALAAEATGLSLLVDARGLLSLPEATALLHDLARRRALPTVIEQPVAPDHLVDLAAVSALGLCAVAAGESFAIPGDLTRLLAAGAAGVLVIDPARSGLVEALVMAEAGRSTGLDLLLAHPATTAVGAATAAALAAGLGSFTFVDLGPRLHHPSLVSELSEDGHKISVAAVSAGHGVTVAAGASGIPLR